MGLSLSELIQQLSFGEMMRREVAITVDCRQILNLLSQIHRFSIHHRQILTTLRRVARLGLPGFLWVRTYSKVVSVTLPSIFYVQLEYTESWMDQGGRLSRLLKYFPTEHTFSFSKSLFTGELV